jgi:glutamate transport system substrate-binding protein
MPVAACGGVNAETITIGVKFDQPGLGMKNADGTMSGFDVDVARYVAQQLGYAAGEIIWIEAPSGQREALIRNGQVNYVVATYSITDARKQKVGFAGPYLVAGQSLLVRADQTGITGAQSLQHNKKLCSVAGSTPAQRIKDRYPGVQLQRYDTYSACVEALKNGAIDAVTTDDVILAGYAAQSPGTFKLVGQPFSREEYGIGLKRENLTLRQDRRRDRDDGTGRLVAGRVREKPWGVRLSDAKAAESQPVLTRHTAQRSRWMSSTSTAIRSLRRSRSPSS